MMLCNTIYYAVLFHAMLCYVIEATAMLCDAMLCNAMLSNAKSCNAMPCYVIEATAMLCYRSQRPLLHGEPARLQQPSRGSRHHGPGKVGSPSHKERGLQNQ